jgi:hypothetical protein
MGVRGGGLATGREIKKRRPGHQIRRDLLAASIKALPYETPGWIANREASQLFSSMDDDYAVGEMDEAGKDNIADFATHVTPRCSLEFTPVEGRVYFMRKADAGP